jgi:hypothetical protein
MSADAAKEFGIIDDVFERRPQDPEAEGAARIEPRVPAK